MYKNFSLTEQERKEILEMHGKHGYKKPLNEESETGRYGQEKKYPDWHGSPYDRGAADSYYGRPRNPHYYPEGTYNGQEVTDLTSEELEAYNAGYDDNESSGVKKDWGE